jgi:hypothetical protein
LAFNPCAGKKGLRAILKNARASVFHEMNHAAV